MFGYIVIACFLLIIVYEIYNYLFNNIPGASPPPKTLDKQTIESIKKEYPEWMDALDINEDCILGYKGNCGDADKNNNSNQIGLNIIDPRGNYLIELVQKDHDFMKNNPNKFYKDMKRSLYYSGSGLNEYGYKNYFASHYISSELDIELDGSMKIGFVWYKNNFSKPISEDIEKKIIDEFLKKIIDNIEVLEIHQDTGTGEFTISDGIGVYSKFLLEHKINDLRYIILLDFAEGTDKKLEEEIKSIYPDVKIYQVNTKDEEKQ